MSSVIAPVRAVPDRASTATHSDRPGISVVREGVEVAARRLPEHRDERRLGALDDLADGRDAPFAQLLGGDRTDPPEPLDRERVEKSELPVGRHYEQAVGLGHPAATLARNLVLATPTVIGRPTPSRMSRRNLAAIWARTRDPLEPANVEQSLVDRKPFDERRGLFEDPEHRLARLGVRRRPRPDDYRLRAQPPRLCAIHRCPHSACLGLVARREHYLGSDDDGAAEETRIISLLDRR